MAKQAKAKTTKGTRNDSRKNGKANKQQPGKTHFHGRKMSEGEKIRMGQGWMRSWPILGQGKRSQRATSSEDSDL